MKLNLGCGTKPLEEWINVDKIALPNIDVVHDLNKFPYPFEDNSTEYVLMDNVLEHLDDVMKVMEEIYRILKPRGKVEIIVPYYKHKNAYSDPTHKHFFTEDSMDYFLEGRKHSNLNFYTNVKFRCVKFRKYSDFPFWHIKKLLSLNHDFHSPLFPSTLQWILEAIK